MTTLLNQIVTRTSLEEQSENAVWIRNNTDFLKVAKISSAEPFHSKPLSNQEQYYFGIFRELLKELKFFYGQFKSMQKIGFSKEKSIHINNRLEVILSSIEESFPAIRRYFRELIHSQVSSDRETAIFAVSCFAKDNDLNKDSSHLFETFAACSQNTIRPFMTAFKFSQNQEISRKLIQVAKSTTRLEIKEACKTIIKYRQKSKP